jgi:toxin-antitoxin system PIN domain toxin
VPVALLEVNILVALAWPPQQHHAAARRWFARRSPEGWATCAVTQNGFLRTMLNPALKTLLTAESVIVLLESSLADARHRRWTEEVDIPAMLRPFAARLGGHRQVTDAYLIALALRHGGILVTLDRGAAALASAAGHAESVELIVG